MILNFDSAYDAEIAKNSLDVDKEPNTERIGRTITSNLTEFKVVWESKDAKLLRSAILAFFLNLELVTATLLRFNPSLPS